MDDQQIGSKQILLKVNIPWCLCSCDFCSRSVIGGYNSKELRAYADALIREIEANASEFADCEVQAIHYGGGLASILGGEGINEVARALKNNYRLAEGLPITMRTTIFNINGANTYLYIRAGITRFDLEVMTLNSYDYSHIKYENYAYRLHEVTYSFIHSDKHNNMGMVLLYGDSDIPTKNFRKSVIAVTDSRSCHVILQRCTGEHAADEAQVQDDLANAREVLAAAGFNEYLPFFFAKPGCEDRYAILRAQGMDTVAFGLGARTRFEGVESVNTGDFDLYCAHSDDYAAILASAQPMASEASAQPMDPQASTQPETDKN